MKIRLMHLFCVVWAISGCQVCRILKHPIPASSPVGLQDERIEPLAEGIIGGIIGGGP